MMKNTSEYRLINRIQEILTAKVMKSISTSLSFDMFSKSKFNEH